MTATWILFTIFSLLRNGAAPEKISGFFRRLGAPLKPRIPFWLALCRSAALLNAQNHPTGFSRQWLAWSPDEQMRHILGSWQDSPRERKNRLWRARVLHRLKTGQSLRSADRLLLPGLEALGICEGERLSQWGSVLLELHPAPMPAAPLPWSVEQDQLLVSFPLNWNLLWQLETFLTPSAPLVYSLGPKGLRRAAQWGEPQELVEILEKGSGAPLPGPLRAHILGQPAVQLSEVTVLEFLSNHNL
jgi:hypothetical protein